MARDKLKERAWKARNKRPSSVDEVKTGPTQPREQTVEMLEGLEHLEPA